MRALIINPSIEKDYEFYHLGTIAVASVVNASERHQAQALDFSFRWEQWESYLRQ